VFDVSDDLVVTINRASRYRAIRFGCSLPCSTLSIGVGRWVSRFRRSRIRWCFGCWLRGRGCLQVVSVNGFLNLVATVAGEGVD